MDQGENFPNGSAVNSALRASGVSSDPSVVSPAHALAVSGGDTVAPSVSLPGASVALTNPERGPAGEVARNTPTFGDFRQQNEKLPSTVPVLSQGAQHRSAGAQPQNEVTPLGLQYNPGAQYNFNAQQALGLAAQGFVPVQNLQPPNFAQQNFAFAQNFPQSFPQQNFPQDFAQQQHFLQNFAQHNPAQNAYMYKKPLPAGQPAQSKVTRNPVHAHQSALGGPDLDVLEDQRESDCSSDGEQGVQEESDEEDAQSKKMKLSFDDKVGLLHTILPKAVGKTSFTKSVRTEADMVFEEEEGEEEDEDLILLESNAIKSELRKVQAFARNPPIGKRKMPEPTDLNLDPKEVPDFPRAYHSGKFLKLRQPPFPRTAAFRHDAIPEDALALTPEDLLLSKARGQGQRTVSLPDKTLRDWEDFARRGLESLSIMDSFFGATLKSIFSKNEKGAVEVKQDIDPKEVNLLQSQVSENLKFSAHVMATLHTNVVMARRDAVLADSDLNSDRKTSLRVLPPGKSLFDERVHSVIKSQAELVRDLACQAPRPQKRPSSSKTTHGSAHTPAKKATYHKPSNSKGQKGGTPSGPGSRKFKPQKPKSSSNKNQNL